MTTPPPAAQRRRPALIHLTVFLLIAASAVAYFLTTYFATGEPKTVADAGWVDVAVNDPGFGHYKYTITATLDPTKKPAEVAYQLDVCRDSFPTSRSVLEGAFLLHGRARISPSSAQGSTGATGSPLSLGSSSAVVTFPQVSDPHVAPPPPPTKLLPSDLEVFPFSTTVFPCPSFFVGPRISGVLEHRIDSEFQHGPFRGPRRLYAWPGLGIPGLQPVAFGGSLKIEDVASYGAFVDNLPTTYVLVGGTLKPGQLTEEIRPVAPDLPELRFTDQKPMTPFVRFYDIDSLQRLQGLGSFMGIIFGIAAGIGGAWLFEILRRSSIPPQGGAGG